MNSKQSAHLRLGVVNLLIVVMVIALIVFLTILIYVYAFTNVRSTSIQRTVVRPRYYYNTKPSSTQTSSSNIDYTSNKCTTFRVKGIPKSGTNWLESTLDIILDKLCTKTVATDLLLCYQDETRSEIEKQYILNQIKHKMIDYNKYDKYFDKIHDKHKRWCQFVTFRDPRNVIVSWHKGLKYNYKNDIDFSNGLKQYIFKNFEKDVEKLIQWWNYFTINTTLFSKQDKSKNEYFNNHTFVYFYENYLLSPSNLLADMITFIGIDNIFKNEDISELAHLTNFSHLNLQNNKINKYQSNYVFGQWNTKQDICKFNYILDKETIQHCNNVLLMLQHQVPILFNIFNQTCPISTTKH